MSVNQIKKHFRSFSNRALIIAIVMLAIYYLIDFLSPDISISPATPIIVIFFLGLTLAIFYFQLRASLKKVSKFVNVFLMATGLKLLGFLIIIGLYAFLNKADAVSFIISFFIIYLVFTLFEITQLLGVQKQLTAEK